MSPLRVRLIYIKGGDDISQNGEKTYILQGKRITPPNQT